MLSENNEIILVQRVTEAIAIRNTIEEILENYGVSTSKISRLLQPERHQLTEASALVIEEYYGAPRFIYTPCGYLEINLDYTAWNKLTDETKKSFYHELSMLDFHEWKEPRKTDYGLIGGWRKQGNTEPVFREADMYIEYTDAMQVYYKALRLYISVLKELTIE